ncbi:MAG: glutamate--tRNA ligase [Alphaproteobacteria bacterium]|nr:glutamate--tRNA ligase [Alphaproteobacteria bacterium]
MTAPKVRFAPSPTGLLHVGNARIALANFLFARRHGGEFLLRLDDTDRERSRPEHAAAIAQDLLWLGLEWDGQFRQSDRMDRYAAAAERLKQAGRLYPCFESEEELRAKREMRIKRGRAPVYDRAMLKLTPEQRATAEAGGKRPYWRFLLSDSTVGWDDLVLGRRQVKLPSVSDPVLIRADGTPLYIFTSVVDDIETGITHLIRGEDHVTNTGVQIDLFAALGASAPAFAHLPLLTGAEGGKLSKRIDSLSLRSLRQDGMEPTALAAYLARLGSSDDLRPLPMAALVESFDLSHVSHSAARFDPSQLLALNRRVLHGLPFAAVADRLPAGATEAFWLAVRGNLDLLGEARGWWDVVAGTIVPPVIEGEQEFFRLALAVLPPEPWDNGVWKTWTEALRAATGRKGRALFHPLRLALTGEEQGPELRELLPLMGRTRAANRLAVAGN